MEKTYTCMTEENMSAQEEYISVETPMKTPKYNNPHRNPQEGIPSFLKCLNGDWHYTVLTRTFPSQKLEFALEEVLLIGN